MNRSAQPTALPPALSPGAPERRRRAVPATACLAMALAVGATALTACSSSGNKAAGTAGTDVASVSRAGVRTGGTLTWAVDASPKTLNAYQADADDGTTTVTQATLPSIFRLDGHGTPKLDTDYVTSAKVTAQDPRQVVTYDLNPKAKWSDGRAIGVDDFTAQWQALAGKNTAYWAAGNAGYDRIASISRGAKAHQVKVTFASPYADWRSLFAPLYPKTVTATADAFNNSVRTALPVSAGPFTVKGEDTKAGTVTLARNDHWWGERAKLDQIVLTAVPRAQRTAQVAAGKLDVAELDPEQTAAAKKAKGVGVRTAPDAAYAQLALNGSAGPLADERVRHAVARAIDRKKIAADVLKPLGLPDAPLGNHLVLPSQNGYADHSSALGSAGTEQAAALLADAGWQRPAAKAGEKTGEKAAGPAGSSRTAASGALTVVQPTEAAAKNGKDLTLRFVLPADSPTIDAVGGQIAQMLAKIGIRTEISKVADDSFFQDHIASGDFDLALYSWPGTAFPATDDTPIFAKPQPAPDGSLAVAENYTRVGTDQIDQLLARAGSELDAGQARDLTNQADSRIWAAAASIPLYQRPQVVALRTNVANAGAFGFESPDFANIGFRK